jgi:hypothetical protein
MAHVSASTVIAAPRRSVLHACTAFVREQPLLAAGVISAAAACGWLVYRAVNPPPPFKDAVVRFVEDNDYAPSMRVLVDAVRRVHAEGLLTAAQARALDAEFVDLVRGQAAQAGRSGASASAGITLDTFCLVMERVGLRDRGLCERIFTEWDVAREGVINLVDILHAVVLTLRGSAREKLTAAFHIMDSNRDGASHGERGRARGLPPNCGRRAVLHSSTSPPPPPCPARTSQATSRPRR